ncbi:hypothetical protein OsI_19221 [Oryza sativa Indica Group]|uniref:Uncharacterized protein n=1 Tax=Oryza sativa subsp. indica TaxID=39946 RepID=A2Y2J1_ORYSI|nr:hypothetical protein OsI_19221 [Oryza sativa Indica Group]
MATSRQAVPRVRRRRQDPVPQRPVRLLELRRLLRRRRPPARLPARALLLLGVALRLPRLAADAPRPPRRRHVVGVDLEWGEMDWKTAALNTILGRWGKKASPEWNISGELCSGFAADKTDWDNYRDINPFIKCDCTFNNNTLCHITRLRVTYLDVVGQIPAELQNLTHLVDLYGIEDFSS